MRKVLGGEKRPFNVIRNATVSYCKKLSAKGEVIVPSSPVEPMCRHNPS